MALTLDLPVDYLSDEAISLASSINQTVQNVFSNVLILPEETSILFLSSKSDNLSTNPHLMTQRFKEQQVKTSFITEEYLSYRVTSDKILQINKLLKENVVKINSDFYPSAYFYENTFWQTIFNFQLAKIAKKITELNFIWVLLFLLIVGLGIILKSKRLPQITFFLTAVMGFTLMSFEMLIISAFQAILGYVFSKVALIFAIILAFVSLGNFWANKIQISPKKILSLIEILILAFCAVFTLLIQEFPSEPTFYLITAIIGFLTGMIFPLTNKIYLKKDKKAKEKTGILYTADLTGAFFGAILPSLFFIPIFGIFKTVVFLGGVNALTLILLQTLEP